MVNSFGKTGLGACGTTLRRALMAVVLVALAACTATYQMHGYVPSDEELAFVTVGKDTRDSVETMIGKPSAEGLLNNVGWFYVQSRWKTVGIRAPKELERQVLAVTFDDKGVVENIERFGLEKGKIVVISRRVTKPNIKGVGFLRQLFGNIGGLNAAQFLK